MSDIFGKTTALEKLCRAVSFDMDIIDPYSGKCMHFQSEQHAYQFFMENVGLDTYSDLIRLKLKTLPAIDMLIGFSVGASAIWKIAQQMNPQKVKRLICFYGSQVRYYTSIKPSVKVDHILSAYESSFDVDELAEQLSGGKNIFLHETPYLHGFMNEFSKNYNHFGYIRYIEWMRQKM